MSSEKFHKFHMKTPVLEFFKFIKKRLQHRYFSVKLVKLLRKPILKNIFEQLLLRILQE